MESRPSIEESGGKPRILVVDDDALVRDGLAAMLRRDGAFEVATAADGFEAQSKLADFCPQVVILDVVMPGIDGLEVCRQMRAAAARADTKAIVLSGYADEDNRQRSLINGADLFLAKPQTAATLRAHILELLEG